MVVELLRPPVAPERRPVTQFVKVIFWSAVLSLSLAEAASAQEPQSQPSPQQLEEVLVTGTRIPRPDYISPNPVKSIGAAEMENLGIVNVAEAMQQITSNVSQFQPSNQGGNPFFVGSTLANLRGLNPYFGTRTLTLVDSRRFVATNQGGSVDLGMVPSTLIQRMEVVTGGASAAYGSDAVAGVVNVLIDKKFEGVKLEADYGGTTHGDGQNYHLGLGAGTKLLGDRANIVFGVEYQKSDSIDDCAGARAWCAQSNGLFLNYGSGFEATGTSITALNPPSTAVIPGAPQRIIMSNLRVNQTSPFAVIFNGTPGATQAVGADAAGTGVIPFNIGQYGTRSPMQTAIGGDGDLLNRGATLYPQIDRRTAFTHFNMDFTDSLTGYAEGSYDQVKGWTNQEVASLAATQYCVHNDNAFLDPATAFGAAALAAQGNGAASNNCLTPFFTPDLTQIVMKKDWNSQIDRFVSTDSKTYRAVLGLTGKYAGSWTWDAYYQFGKTDRSQLLQDNNTSKRMQMAVDSVIGPNGQPMCRATRDGVGIYTPPIPGDPTYEAYLALSQNCVPLDIFGNQASAAALDYAFGDLTEFNTIKQNVLAASTAGELWQGWGAGPLAAALGVEYRTEKLTNDVGDLPVFQRTDFGAQYGDAFAGKTTVTEGFLELEMPLLRDQPAARLLSINGAVRRTHNKTEDELNADNAPSTVDATSWKVASIWEPLGWLRIRGSYSHDIRAAGFRELFYSQTIPADPPGTFFGFGGNTNPWLPAGFFGPPYDPATVLLQGNTALKPETAKTGTVGLVLSPGGWAQGMQLSVDYYKIRLLNSIRGGVIAQTITNCYQGDENYCALITGVPGGTPGPNSSTSFSDIISIRAPYQNGNPYEASGVDFSANYVLPLSELVSSARGSLGFNLSGTRALKAEVQRLNYPNYVAIDIAGQSGANGFLADFASMPKWVGDFSVSYFQGPLTLTSQLRYTGTGHLNLEAPYVGPQDSGYDPNLTGSVSDNTVPSAVYVSLTGSYNLPFTSLQSFQVWASINNLTDRDPPFANGGIGGANAIFFDSLGRTYRAGVRMQF